MSNTFDSIMLVNSKYIVFVMTDVQFNLRIPEELKEKVKKAAQESGRSINAEAQYRLEQSFSQSEKIRITDFDGLSEPAMSIEMDNAVVGLMQSQYHQVEIQNAYDDKWQLIYHSLRCMLTRDQAQLLISKGCTLKK